MSLTVCHTLWIGPSLGAVEKACLRSILRQGHRLALYCYHPPQNAPDGIEIRDAREILPEARVVRYRNGSPALFSNLFRYELQRRGAMLWVDADVYLLRPLDLSSPYIMGDQGDGLINTAVLRIPAESPLLPPLIAQFDEKRPPFWLPRWERWDAWRRRVSTGKTQLDRMPWGTTGPHALTALAKKYGLESRSVAPTVFYPVPWPEAHWITEPQLMLDSVITPDTIGIHLWNERIKALKDIPAPAGSFLARIQAEGA